MYGGGLPPALIARNNNTSIWKALRPRCRLPEQQPLRLQGEVGRGPPGAPPGHHQARRQGRGSRSDRGASPPGAPSSSRSGRPERITSSSGSRATSVKLGPARRPYRAPPQRGVQRHRARREASRGPREVLDHQPAPVPRHSQVSFESTISHARDRATGRHTEPTRSQENRSQLTRKFLKHFLPHRGSDRRHKLAAWEDPGVGEPGGKPRTLLWCVTLNRRRVAIRAPNK